VGCGLEPQAVFAALIDRGFAMHLTFDVPKPLDYFASLVASDDSFALFEAAVSLAHDAYRDLDVQSVLDDVDQMQARLRHRIPSDAGQLQKLQILNQFLYGDLGFGGNVNNYYDPDNSYIHRILQTRRGIPISLAVLWMELAQSLGLVVSGIGFPGHFMVKVALPIGPAILDPQCGKSLSREQLSELLEPYRRQHGQLDEMEAPLALYLQKTSPRGIISRMLRNLNEIYKSQNDAPLIMAVQNRLAVLVPDTGSVA
jgi:regulator of sirC expression with transglutaminase-like and TPR domain